MVNETNEMQRNKEGMEQRDFTAGNKGISLKTRQGEVQISQSKFTWKISQ